MESDKRACCISLLFIKHRKIKERKNRCRALPGSMTVEAAFILPLMILAVWILIFPLKVMESERRLQNRMEMTAKAMAVTAYIRERKSGLLKEDSSYTGILESFGTAAAESFSAAALAALPETKLMERMAFIISVR